MEWVIFFWFFPENDRENQGDPMQIYQVKSYNYQFYFYFLSLKMVFFFTCFGIESVWAFGRGD